MALEAFAGTKALLIPVRTGLLRYGSPRSPPSLCWFYRSSSALTFQLGLPESPQNTSSSRYRCTKSPPQNQIISLTTHRKHTLEVESAPEKRFQEKTIARRPRVCLQALRPGAPWAPRTREPAAPFPPDAVVPPSTRRSGVVLWESAPALPCSLRRCSAAALTSVTAAPADAPRKSRQPLATPRGRLSLREAG